MKAVVCRSPGELVLEDRPEPAAPPPGWARVAVSHVGICGTDYHIFEGKHPFLAYPRIMGHEVSGTVVERSDGVDLAIGEPVIINPYLACGKCIACRHGKPNCCVRIEVLGVHRDGAMCDEVLVPAQNLYPANGLSLADAAAVEFLAIGAHAVRRSLGAPGQRTLVIGAGPIGLGTALFARIAGLDVSLLDMSTERLGFAESALGFAALDASKAPAAELVRQSTGGEGFDLVFDATGNTQSVQSAFAHVAHGGTLVLVSVVKDDITFSDPEFHKREMTLVGSRNALKADFDHVAASIRDGAVPLAKLVTHRTTLAGTPRDLARWAHEKSGLIKAVIEVG
ncbi:MULTISPECIES: zinc-binding alcohol dehydrogenase family protein [unclassified Mesorhizobium]|uniref:zinc-binding alcohol dehydrogenase family protein n=1 Tax=unclassified Mesorhizobium TaxID=325217 RepID=UPI000FCAAE1B|nr:MULTISPECIES: zinc-binding alcohol dehydrogenase family protein [unclassified Mesorhizobium]TGP23518.1 zinc-binding alcohol dehydrogenase family protein [Mesorhizobium sp. M1D.F.Ca.ET.231.01.1.1]TGP33661.1 zinc-binding alcohol dehydrogenase family protein [Mesorhizobium sp. M1D.F.Ca.ET.234.01.1.1]TGS47027.1 zinc-binding alcohol dehydrogenase family protein [Mesorhizobium sp. M1D.F.Ca.ET.184.01.1.1]TGS62286.1 zinc-binding alcohol dehydrogenase family protein [Mesorhizobium sp. M1D.F.Ca.ET.183